MVLICSKGQMEHAGGPDPAHRLRIPGLRGFDDKFVNLLLPAKYEEVAYLVVYVK